jgi:hypothetical protein
MPRSGFSVSSANARKTVIFGWYGEKAKLQNATFDFNGTVSDRGNGHKGPKYLD